MNIAPSGGYYISPPPKKKNPFANIDIKIHKKIKLF